MCSNALLVLGGPWKACLGPCKLANLSLAGILVELPSRRRGLNSKFWRPLGVPGTKREEEQIDVVYFDNEN